MNPSRPTGSKTNPAIVAIAALVLQWTVEPARAQGSPAEPACGTENLLAGKTPSEAQMPGNAALLTDGEIVADGALWDGPAAAELGAAGSLTYDLGAPRRIGALYLQADANDTYRVLGSLDGAPGSFALIAEAPNVVIRGPGLRARTIEIQPVNMRFLRVTTGVGDGANSISEFAAYCRAPSPFPAAMQLVEAPMAAVPTAPAAATPGLTEPAQHSVFGWFEALIAAAILLIAGLGLRTTMAARAASATAGSAAFDPEPYFPLVLVLFTVSGCAALIYEIVWFQLLQLVIGSSAISIAVLLGTFMGGMCIGSLALARLVSTRVHPLRVYALLEVAIALCGLAMLPAMPIVQHVYTSVVGHGIPGLLLRGLFAALCLLPPTVMMGATLPAAARWVEASARGIAWMGYFYGANTLGAVVGCVLAGFFLLRVFDMPTATYVAAGLNGVVAIGAFGLSRLAPGLGSQHDAAPPTAASKPAALSVQTVYVTIGLSGMTALAAEVLWTRQFWLLLGGTTYTFSIILAVFLIGIGLGSAVGSALARRAREPLRALGFAQMLLILAIAWTAWNLSRALPFWPVNPDISPSTWYQFQLDFVRCVWAILPAASLWGASFPFALAAVASEGQDGGRIVGRIYAANTVGAIIGALGASLVVIAWLGVQAGERILIASAALAAIAAFMPALSQSKPIYQARTLLPVLITLGLASLCARNVAPIPPLLVGHGRSSAVSFHHPETYLYVGEGMNSSLAVSRDQQGILSYHNAGKVQASTQPQDMRLQRMLGHLTTLVPDHPRSVLVIACGAGVTAGAASIDPRVEHLTIAEIEPLVPKAAAKYFGEYNHHVVTNPKVRVEIDDARHFLNTTHETFDAITSDPFDPWVKGAAALYTKEFWELAKRHLRPGGVVTVFVQLYQAGTAAVKSEVATFFEVFPQGVIFGNTVHGEGYDVVLLGQRDPKPIDVDAMTRLLERPDFALVKKSLRQTGFNSAVALLSTYGSRGPELGAWLQDAQINRDRDLRLQFLAGFDLNANEAGLIYRGILPFRKYPADFFTGSAPQLDALRAAMLGRPP
jgi:spermidine synthase